MNDSDTIKTVELEFQMIVTNVFKCSEMYILLYLRKRQFIEIHNIKNPEYKKYLKIIKITVTKEVLVRLTLLRT